MAECRTMKRADATFALIGPFKSCCCACSVPVPLGKGPSSTLISVSHKILTNPAGGCRISCRILCYRWDVGESNGCLPAFGWFLPFSTLWRLCARRLHIQLG